MHVLGRRLRPLASDSSGLTLGTSSAVVNISTSSITVVALVPVTTSSEYQEPSDTHVVHVRLDFLMDRIDDEYGGT